MTNRMPWSDKADPRPLWKVWDEFGMTDSEMIGYWSMNCPVTTNDEKIIATVYKRKGAALISIASWADTDRDIKISIDWKKLGLNPAKATLIAPEIRNFQPSRVLKIAGGAADELPVQKGKGWLLIVKEN